METQTIKRFRSYILEEFNIRKRQSELIKSIDSNIAEGLKHYTQQQLSEYKQFDEEWIVGLESFFPSLQKITRDIRSNLKSDEEILPIEKTRRTNPESIRHLLRHTRYIKDIEENGDIIPEKVLNALHEIDYGIYENRFIMTLIDRLFHYLNRTLLTMKDLLSGTTVTHYNLQNQFQVNDIEFDFDVKVVAKEPIEISDESIQNHRIYYRLQKAFELVSSLYHSEFMRLMTRYKKVQPPILKTQIILKNPDFRQAYLLWLYLDRLHELDYKAVRETKEREITDTYEKEIDDSMLMMLLTLFENTSFGSKITPNDKVYKKELKPEQKSINYANELNLNDVPIYEIEPQLASQYHLDRMMDQFGEIYQSLRIKDDSERALKQVLLDQYKIADQIYDAYFELSNDEDIFDLLLREANPVAKYQEALNKYKLVKIARDIKERLYHDSLKQEEVWIEKLNELKEQALTHLYKQITEHHDHIIEDEKIAFEKKVKQFEEMSNTRFNQEIKVRERKLTQQLKEMEKEYNNKLKNFKREEKLRIEKVKKELNEKLAIEKKKIQEKLKKTSNDVTKKHSEKKQQTKKILTKVHHESKKEIQMESNKIIQTYKEEIKKKTN